MNRVGLIDYGMGNLHSVAKALEHAGASVHAIKKPDDLQHCDRVVLPGVGAFRDCADALQNNGMDEAIKTYTSKGNPFLGICLGMQVLMDLSLEFGEYRGLGLIVGTVKPLPEGLPALGCKIPHMGWNDVTFANALPIHPVLSPLHGQQVYYVHAYYCAPTHASHILAACSYGDFPFASAMGYDNIIGVQFHPEKSQRAGLAMLKCFVNWK
ncbi:MAG: imidazole glycerol phosphate synthase subunit HisH [Mariprofundaceae bacterium]|nr:imidazole glycerol phosphate synthase subunit HisH [Mariprofundaceae bacterium]